MPDQPLDYWSPPEQPCSRWRRVGRVCLGALIAAGVGVVPVYAVLMTFHTGHCRVDEDIIQSVCLPLATLLHEATRKPLLQSWSDCLRWVEAVLFLGQYPLYGAIVAAVPPRRMTRAVLIILAAHLVAAVAAFCLHEHA